MTCVRRIQPTVLGRVTSIRTSRLVLAMGLLGALIALGLLLPLPSAVDIYAARRWGVGAGYVGIILGFPLGILAVPMSVGVHPFPAAEDAGGAGVTAAIIA